MSLSKNRRWFIYVISCALFVLSQFYRSSIAVISPNLVQELQLDTRSLGIISAAFFYAFALMQIPVAFYLDSVGPRIIMTALSLLAAAGALVFAWGASPTALIVGRILLGIGMACNLMGPLKLVTAWFSAVRFATLAAIFFSIGTAGSILASSPLVWLTTLLGWRITFVLGAGINVVLVLVFGIIARDYPESDARKLPATRPPLGHHAAWQAAKHLLINRDYWLISFGTFSRYGIYAAIQSLWAAPYLMNAVGMSQMMTGNLLLVMSIGLIVGSPVCGWLSDVWLHTRKGLIIAGLALMSLVLLSLASMSGRTWLPLFFILFFVFGFFSGSGQIMYAHIKDLMPLQRAGAAMAGINFFTIMGVAFFLHGLGSGLKWVYPDAQVPAHAFRIAFLVFSAILMCTAVFYLKTHEASEKADR